MTNEQTSIGSSMKGRHRRLEESEVNFFESRQIARAILCLAVAVVGVLARAGEAYAEMDVAGTLIQFNDNGAWSWFEDERAIVDVTANKLIVSSVANSAGTGGAPRHGDVDVALLDLASGAVTRFTLNEGLQADDHDSAALWKRADGRYVAMYSTHSSDPLTRWRVSTNPGDISSWSPEQTFTNAANATYSNLHYLPNDSGGAGRLYNFTRTVGFDPNILVSSNQGSSWSYGGRLLTEGDSGDRPYLRYASNGQRIHLIATNQHPRDFDNSIYHAYIENGQLFSSTGAVIDANLFDASAVAPSSLTPVFTTGTAFGGVTMDHAWTVDIEIDAAGSPYAVFQTRANNNPLDHRYFYARFNGASWSVNPLAKAGGYLYQSEGDYTGLVALDPSDPNRLFMSSKIDPRTGATMAHYEIFEGVTANGGTSWQWTPITYGSTVDNLRPIVPKWDDDHTALLWMRGNYATYVSYNLDVVGLTNIQPIQLRPDGDLNRDGAVNLIDFSMFVGGLHGDLSGLSFDEAYGLGDLNGDLANNHRDFLLFKAAYDAANGSGAFVAALQAPEPAGLSGTGAMLLVAGAAVIHFGRRRAATAAAAAVLCLGAVGSTHAQAILAVDVDDRGGDVELNPGTNTVAGYQAFTLTGSTAAAPSTKRTLGGFDITFTAVNAAGNAQGGIDDRDRATPASSPSLAQLYDDLLFTAALVGPGGGLNLAINNGGVLQPNTEYLFSMYAFDSGSTNAPQPRTATWLDGNSGDRLVTNTSFNGNVLPTTNDQYRFSGVVRTDASGALLLKGRNTTPLTSTGGVNIGVIVNGFEISPFVEVTLEVNTTTGAARFLNEQTSSFDMNFYEIRSTAGSLNMNSWNSLDDQDPSEGAGVGAGWEQATNSNANLLSELRLDGMAHFAPGASAAIGTPFATSAAQDLQFWYAPPDGSLRRGIVKYVQAESIPGDFDSNQVVNSADLAQWRSDFGINSESEADNDGDSDGNDFLIWQQNLGISGATSSLAAVPEPDSWGLIAGALTMAPAGFRRIPR